jgi:hypothetical protein
VDGDAQRRPERAGAVGSAQRPAVHPNERSWYQVSIDGGPPSREPPTKHTLIPLAQLEDYKGAKQQRCWECNKLCSWACTRCSTGTCWVALHPPVTHKAPNKSTGASPPTVATPPVATKSPPRSSRERAPRPSAAAAFQSWCFEAARAPPALKSEAAAAQSPRAQSSTPVPPVVVRGTTSCQEHPSSARGTEDVTPQCHAAWEWTCVARPVQIPRGSRACITTYDTRPVVVVRGNRTGVPCVAACNDTWVLR